MLEVTDQNYDEVMREASEKNLPVVLDFGTPWCGPCQQLAPHIKEMSEKYEGKAIIAKVDASEAQDLATKFGIRNVPVVIFLKDGNVVERQTGYDNKTPSLLIEKLEAIL